MKHEKKLQHLDLFSGIGGFALATEMVWPKVTHTFCDIEPFAQAILKKHWPEAKIHGDIRTLTNTKGQRTRREPRAVRGAQRRQNDELVPDALNEDSVYLLTGGFPCQPFSNAGRRLGTEDDRHLWPEMLRVIREFHPRWVVGENVGGFVTWNDGLVLEQVHADLEGEGYEVQAFIIPAVSVNAPHRRDRVWIVAHAERDGCPARAQPRGTTKATGQQPPRPHDAFDLAGADSLSTTEPDAAYHQGTDWSQNWVEVAARLCTLDDGLPNGLARPRGWRNAALKGAGNAIVPQVAAEIFRAIKTIDAAE